MKLGNVISSLPALQKVANEPLSPKTLYWVSKMMSTLDTEINFYNGERLKIIENLGKDIGDGKWEIQKENRPEFEKRMNDLLNIEIETDFKVVKIPETENIRLSYNDIKMLEGFIELNIDEND